MSDKKEYWKELFGDDFPEELAEELGLTDMAGDGKADQKPQQESAGQPVIKAPAFTGDEGFDIDDSGSQWLNLDQSYFGAGQDEATDGALSDDTNIIPDGESITAMTRDSIPAEIPGAELIYDEGEAGKDDQSWDLENENNPIHFERRKRTGCMGGLIYFAFIVAVSLILCCFAWMAANDVLALNKDYVEADVTVTEGYTIDELADTLKDEGFIKYTSLFKLFAKVYHADQKITAGTYTLSTDYDYRALISSMSTGSGSMAVDSVVIPEGKTMEEIFQILADNEVCDYASLMEAAANYDFDYDFLDADTLGDVQRLEGYLFPDTYTFYKGSTAESTLDKFLSNFQSKTDAYNVDKLVSESSYSLDEIITIASMIQMEAANDDEMPTIASVIHNRLDDGMYLEIDATIQYALEERVDNLSDAQRVLDTPYNTYTNKGLPPTPITNPGIAAILAALAPEDTDYYYYALHVDGNHEFFKDASSHKTFVNSEKFAYYEG